MSWKQRNGQLLKPNKMENMFCLIDSNRGIYIPQQFAKNWGDSVKGMTEEQKSVLLSGPEAYDYWNAWEEVVNEATFMFNEQPCTLYEDNDLFAVPVTKFIDLRKN